MKFSIPLVSEGITVYDETGTEVDADVFEEVAQQPNAGVFTIKYDNGKLIISWFPFLLLQSMES